MALIGNGHSDDLATVEVVRQGSEAHVTLAGEIDMSNSAAIGDRIRAAGDEAVALTVDLTGLTFLDSSGVAVLAQLSEGLAAQGKRLSVIAGPDTVAGRTLRLMGMQHALPIEGTQP